MKDVEKTVYLIRAVIEHELEKIVNHLSYNLENKCTTSQVKEALGFKVDHGTTGTGENLESFSIYPSSTLSSFTRSFTHGYNQYEETKWLAWFDFLRNGIGLEKTTEDIQGYIELAQTAGWYLPYEHICWISERPSTIHLNNRGGLDDIKGPVIVFRDGWAIHVDSDQY